MKRAGDASCSYPEWNLHSIKAELQDKAKPEVVVPVVRRVVVPVRHTAVPGVVVPAATTVHAVRALADTFPLF